MEASRAYASQHTLTLFAIGISMIAFGLIWVIINISTTSVAFIMCGSILVSAGFSGMISEIAALTCDKYVERIQSTAVAVLDYQEADKIISMSINTMPRTWKHLAVKNGVPAMFMAFVLILLILPVNSPGELALNIAVNACSIVISICTLRNRLSTAVHWWSKSILLERVDEKIESY